jgi:HD-like signal output (HDOD) protein
MAMAHHTKIGSFLYIKWILPPVLQRAAQTFERQAQQSLSVGGAPHKKV